MQPTECTIIGIDFKHQALQGSRCDVEFHNYTRGLTPTHVIHSHDIVCDIEEEFTTERRECIRIDKDKYIVWTPELEQYIGKPLAHIKQLEVNVRLLNDELYNQKKKTRTEENRSSFWMLQYANKEDVVSKLEEEKCGLFKSGLCAAIVAATSIIGNMYLWSTYVS